MMDGDIDLGARLVLIETTDDPRGRVAEVACRRHETEILAELRQLHKGCSATWAPKGSSCKRCKSEAR